MKKKPQIAKAAEDFISRASTVEADKPAPRAPEPTVRFTFDCPEDLHRQFKIHATTEGRSMKQILVDLIRTEVQPAV